MNENERVKLLRKQLDFTMEEFGERVGVTKAAISNIEKANRSLTEQMIKSICREFNVNELWLREGRGEMFLSSATFSLDEYAQKNQLSELELEIVKGYMSLDKDVRSTLISHFQSILGASNIDEDQAYIDRELESYRRELESERKGAEKSSASRGKRGSLA